MQFLNIKKNIIIGTAQLGINYGIANKTKRIIIEDKIKFLNHCYQNSFDFFDTAYAYKNSHKIIGKWIRNNNVSPKLSTKIPNIGNYRHKTIECLFTECLKELNVNKIDNLFLHKSDNWNNTSVKKYIESILSKNLISKFGLSIYEIKDIIRDPYIKILQIPANIFNQSIIDSDKINRFITEGGSVHIRSLFLQGLLLIEPKDIPSHLSKTKKGVIYFNNIAKELKINKIHLALICMHHLLPKAKLIIGLDNITQLKEIINIENIDYKKSDIIEVLKIGKRYSGGLWDTRNW
jgi:aryl-alcohol dehydrogenase-like predicted oxidoreductase